MDDCLNRILSLLPKGDSGQYIRGSKKELASYLNLPHNTVTEWISGRNKSYLKYLYQIAEKYQVSVEWLRDGIDKKEPTPVSESGLEPDRARLIELAKTIDLKRVRAMLVMVDDEKR